jgi:hypothetical protein
LIHTWGWSLPLATCAVYMIVVLYLGPRLMANRAPFNLKWPMILWNLTLFTFSVYCSIGFALRLAYEMSRFGADVALCDTNGHLWKGVDLFFTWIFLISKFVELGDTLFLVLRKSRVIFLHWYHHVTVLLFCWHVNESHSSNTILFGIMNAWVHAVMYGYYTLTSLNYKPSWGEWVTRLQLSQMFFGIVLITGALFSSTLSTQCRIAFLFTTA